MNKYHGLDYYINYICSKIADTYNDTVLCQQYAWWILQAICKKTKTELIIQEPLMLSPEQLQQLDNWLHQLIDDKKPLQYLLGSVPFINNDILVETPTLIPRPETEEWCANIIENLKLLNNKKINILDLATGSGCIAIALAHEIPQARIVATDIADTAIALTEKNIEHNIIRNVTVIKSDLFNALPTGLQFDLIVSNPPYIAPSELNNLDDAVTRWEDHNALFASDNGLAIIKKIIAQAPNFIQTNDEMRSKNIPQIIIEIGYAQGATVKELMNSANYNDVFVHKDLEGKDRCISGRVDYVANSSP